MSEIVRSALRVFLLFSAIVIISIISSVLTVTYLKMDSQGLVPRAFSIGGDHGRREFKAPPQIQKPHPELLKDRYNAYDA